MADGLETIAELADPVGRELARWTRPNGLDIARVRGPLGVVGIIYESRPNVTADAGALVPQGRQRRASCAAARRASTPRARSSPASQGGPRGGRPAAAAIQLVPTTDRAAVGHLLRMDGMSTSSCRAAAAR